MFRFVRVESSLVLDGLGCGSRAGIVCPSIRKNGYWITNSILGLCIGSQSNDQAAHININFDKIYPDKLGGPQSCLKF